MQTLQEHPELCWLQDLRAPLSPAQDGPKAQAGFGN